MEIKNFNFLLPTSLIAQKPLGKRDQSKLFVYNTKLDQIIHTKFVNIANYIHKHAIVVLNNTKVIPAKLIGNSNGKEVSILLVDIIEEGSDFVIYSCLLKRSKIKKHILFKDNVSAQVIKHVQDKTLIKFNLNKKDFLSFVNNYGYAPLPPYIKRHRPNLREHDINRYQTVYANFPGSIAAPTAGMHFTNSILSKIKEKDIEIINILLHVGLGTFKPIMSSDIEQHKMLQEYYSISKKTQGLIEKAIKNDKKILSIGTTSTRALESYFISKKSQGFTDLYIYPGREFNIDMLLTNFHLPKSTPLVLLTAFLADKLKKQGENLYIEKSIKIFKKLYKEAINKNYRFYSYGDAMLVI